MAVTESYDAIVKRALSSLSLTEEQWETSTEPIIAENLQRLSLMVTQARKSVGVANATLDIGFGYGYTTAALRAAFPGARNVGLEHPSRALTWLPSFRRLASELETRIVGGDAYELPFADESFDVVFAGEILEHLLPMRLVPEFLPEVLRVLRPGGVACLSTPNLVSLNKRVSFMRGSSPLWLLSEEAAALGATHGHIREFTAAEVAKLLTLSGFQNVSVKPVGRSLGRDQRHHIGLRTRLAHIIQTELGRLWPRVLDIIVASGSKR